MSITIRKLPFKIADLPTNETKVDPANNQEQTYVNDSNLYLLCKNKYKPLGLRPDAERHQAYIPDDGPAMKQQG
jgi:hypothetical protein